MDKPDEAWVEYAYDALGRRVKRTTSAGATSLYWYVGEDMVLETDGTGTEVARYTHGLGIDAPLKLRRDGASHYYHEDPLGSIVLLTNAAQAETNTYTYDAFGRIIEATGQVPNPYTYTGREWDSDIGMYYYRARHYDPAVGRFLQTDPVGPTMTDANLYAYVGSNPVNWVDPEGMFGEVSRSGMGRVVILGTTVDSTGQEVPVWGLAESGQIISVGGDNPNADKGNSDILADEVVSSYVDLAASMCVAGGLSRWGGTWIGKIEYHAAHAGGPHQFNHLQIMIRTGSHTTRHIRIPWPW